MTAVGLQASNASGSQIEGSQFEVTSSAPVGRGCAVVPGRPTRKSGGLDAGHLRGGWQRGVLAGLRAERHGVLSSMLRAGPALPLPDPSSPHADLCHP
jgi:hypothetical protein